MIGNSGFRMNWKGDDVKRRAHRAIERGMIATAETAVSEAKQRVHRLTGTLSRSIHAAPAQYNGEHDHRRARIIDLAEDGGIAQGLPTWRDDSAIIWVGSWLPYAFVEEVVRKHTYLGPAFDLAKARAVEKFRMAFAQEGLK